MHLYRRGVGTTEHLEIFLDVNARGIIGKWEYCENAY